MKKLILLFLLLIQLISSVRGQTFDKGTIVVSAGYGFPNLIILPFRVAYKISDFSNVSFSGYGPVLTRAEYALTEKIGIGAISGFSTMSVGYTFKDWNAYKTYKVDYHAKLSWTSPSIGVRASFHFATGEKIDPYFGIGGGVSGNTFSYSDDSPWESHYPKPGITSVYINIGLGMRYYFTKNIGMYFEGGWDKASLLQIGVTARF